MSNLTKQITDILADCPVSGGRVSTWAIEEIVKVAEAQAQKAEAALREIRDGLTRQASELRAMRAGEGETGWLIDTAPKDGTKILAWSGEFGTGETFSATRRWLPTHWQPLPVPPTELRAGAVPGEGKPTYPTTYAAFTDGMKAAAEICGSLAETTYDDADAFEAATGCEAAIMLVVRQQQAEQAEIPTPPSPSPTDTGEPGA